MRLCQMRDGGCTNIGHAGTAGASGRLPRSANSLVIHTSALVSRSATPSLNSSELSRVVGVFGARARSSLGMLEGEGQPVRRMKDKRVAGRLTSSSSALSAHEH